MNDATRFRASSRVIFTPLADGTGVLLDLDSKFYFTLNTTGVAVWRCLLDGDANVTRLAAELVERFDVSVDDAISDVRTLLGDLVGESLVEQVG